MSGALLSLPAVCLHGMGRDSVRFHIHCLWFKWLWLLK